MKWAAICCIAIQLIEPQYKRTREAFGWNDEFIGWIDEGKAVTHTTYKIEVGNPMAKITISSLRRL
jgi:hypothetical protein